MIIHEQRFDQRDCSTWKPHKVPVVLNNLIWYVNVPEHTKPNSSVPPRGPAGMRPHPANQAPAGWAKDGTTGLLLPVNQNSYGKSPSFIGKSIINGSFSIVMLDYQRVHHCWFHMFISQRYRASDPDDKKSCGWSPMGSCLCFAGFCPPFWSPSFRHLEEVCSDMFSVNSLIYPWNKMPFAVVFRWISHSALPRRPSVLSVSSQVHESGYRGRPLPNEAMNVFYESETVDPLVSTLT